MRARDVIGRKIVKVHQKYCPAVDGYPGAWNVTHFTLDNGTTVCFDATPHEVYEVVEVIVNKPQRRLAKGGE